MAVRTAADGKWVGRIARTAADGVGAREWVEMGGEKNKMQPTNPNAHTYVNGYAVTSVVLEPNREPRNEPES